ncbi:MAG TPA: response regulator [Tepidisphaeraceae bacterium]
MASVLVVDDDSDSRELLAAYLRKAGLVVQAARHGKDALQFILDRTPDVLVLDLMMPEMNGVELLQVMRSYLRWASLPVVVLTAYPSGPHIERARDLGMAALFEKTRFELADLFACIQKLIADRRGRCTAG